MLFQPVKNIIPNLASIKQIPKRIPAAIGEYIPQNFNSFVGSCFFESLVAIILPTTVPTAVGRVRRRFFDYFTVIVAR